MLALGRREKQSVVLDNDVRITVIKVSGNRVTLGVEAPAHVTILREELIEDEACLVSSDT